MDYAFFESLSADQAQQYLQRFRDVEREALEQMIPSAAVDGIRLEYSVDLLPAVLKWLLTHVHFHYVPIPDEEPSWIKQAHPRGILEYDEDSKSIVMRAGYYLGECFARLPGLRWSTGDPRYMGKHMPVIAGFRGGDEMPVLVVVDNVFAGILGGEKPMTRIDSAIDTWFALRPPREK
ncbi:MAG: hypothetical protein AB7O59_17945 [Pirellulales bacterium]